MTVILNKPALSELAHYGVKGMKWGVRKERDSSSRKPGYSVDKDGRITIDKGHELQRVFDSKNGSSSGAEGANYFAFTEKDINVYRMMMGAGVDSKFAFIRKMASDKASTLVAIETLHSPSRKEAFDILKQTIDEVGPPKGVQRFNKDFSDKDAEMWYQEANTKIVLEKDSSFNKAYYDKLRKNGYNILLDEMDSGFLSDLPIIVLDGAKSLRLMNVSDLTGQDVRAAKAFVKMQENTTVKSVEEYAKEASKSNA